MTRINLEQIAAEFGLVVEKRNVGTYGQWKDAEVVLYLADNRDAGKVASGVYPPVENYVRYPSIENIYVATSVVSGQFYGRRAIYNDTFNEDWLRREIGKLLAEYFKPCEEPRPDGLKKT